MYRKLLVSLVCVAFFTTACSGGGEFDENGVRLETSKNDTSNQTNKPKPSPIASKEKSKKPDTTAGDESDASKEPLTPKSEPMKAKGEPAPEPGPSNQVAAQAQAKEKDDDDDNDDLKKGLLFGGLGALAGVLATLGFQKLSKKKAEKSEEEDGQKEASNPDIEVLAQGEGRVQGVSSPTPAVADATETTTQSGDEIEEPATAVTAVSSFSGEGSVEPTAQATGGEGQSVLVAETFSNVDGIASTIQILYRAEDDSFVYRETDSKANEDGVFESQTISEVAAVTAFETRKDEILEQDDELVKKWQKHIADIQSVPLVARNILISLDSGLAPDLIKIQEDQESGIAFMKVPAGFGSVRVDLNDRALQEFENRGVSVPFRSQDRTAAAN